MAVDYSQGFNVVKRKTFRDRYNHGCNVLPMFRADRLAALISEKGLSQSELARRVGVSQATIWKLVKEPSQGSKHLHRIAAELGVSPAYLAGDTDDPTPGLVPAKVATFEELAAEHGLIPIRHLDLAFGMGATYVDNPVDEEMRMFPETFIRAFTSAPPELIYFAHGVGDSMMPTVHPNDLLIIDASTRRMTMSDQIWAFNYAGLGMIKRLRPMPDGGVKILSDNQSVPAETAYDGELNLFGRVVAVVRKI